MTDSEPDMHRPWRPPVVVFVVALVAVLLLAEVGSASIVDTRRGLESPTKDIQVFRQLDFMYAYDEGADIVVAGTSMAGVGIDPKIVAAEIGSDQVVFNASLGCGNPLVMEDWLTNFVATQLSPEVVVLSLAPTDFDRDACPRSWTPIDMITTPAGRVSTDPRHYLRTHSSLWRNRDWLRGINNLPFLVFDKEWTWDVTFRPDGFWRIDAYADVDKETYLLNPSRTQIRIEEPYVTAFEATIDGLLAQDIAVVVAEVPMAQRWIDHLGGSAITYRQAQEHLRNRAEAHGATFIGTTPSLHENNLFIDEGHMTPDGAAGYSVYLAREIAEILPTS